VSGDRHTWSFEDPPSLLGVPYVSLTAEITSTFDGLTPSTRKADPALTAATPFWPVDDPEIVALAREITAGSESLDEKTSALLRWLKPNTNIQSGGPVQGSRWGVKQVLAQKFGHCWDSSDLFVTLARSVGVPCRQVGGWLYGTSGHIWAEILLEGKGWLQVDPTSGSVLPCGTRHIPWFTSEDGDMPTLYVEFPNIEVIDSN
jgi:transglutaminase-like putative cysteine protease